MIFLKLGRSLQERLQRDSVPDFLSVLNFFGCWMSPCTGVFSRLGSQRPTTWDGGKTNLHHKKHPKLLDESQIGLHVKPPHRNLPRVEAAGHYRKAFELPWRGIGASSKLYFLYFRVSWLFIKQKPWIFFRKNDRRVNERPMKNVFKYQKNREKN